MGGLPAIFWTEKLIALAVAVQSLELIVLKNAFADQGVWRWETLQNEYEVFPRKLRAIFEHLLPYRRFLAVLWAGFLAALLSLFVESAALSFILFATTLLTAVRWRGAFNGGSDSMTLMILGACLIAALFQQSALVQYGCIIFIAVQCCASYFMSGISKIRSGAWRTGEIFQNLFRSEQFQTTEWTRRVSDSRRLSLILSWSIIAFELLFPLALLSPAVCMFFIAGAIAFHIANAYFFGLNRFLLAWLAAYPSLYFFASHNRA